MGFVPRGVLFDLDGVIIKSMEQHLEAWQYAFSEQGIQIRKEDFFQLEGRGVRSVTEELTKKYDLDPALKSGIINTKMAYYNRIYKPEFYDGLFELLEFLKKKQVKTAIITGATRERVDELLENHLRDFFDISVSSDDVINTKPFPEPYLKGAALLDLKPSECVVIENAPLGIRSAKDAGMVVIAVRTTMEDEYLQQADYIVDNMVHVQRMLVKTLAS